MKTYGGVELNLHAFWTWILEAANWGQKFATTESGEMKDKLVAELVPEHDVVCFMLDSYIPGCRGEMVRL